MSGNPGGSVEFPSKDGTKPFLGKESVEILSKKIFIGGFKEIFKNIEISKRRFLVLLLNTIGVTSLGAISIYFSGNLINSSRILGGTGLALGIILGLVSAFLFGDYFKQSFIVMGTLYLISFFLNILGILIEALTPQPVFPIFIFSISIMLFIFMTIITLKMFLNYTSLLERGRILALIEIFDVGYILLLYSLINILNIAIIPLIIIAAIGILFIKYRHYEISQNTITIPEKNSSLEPKEKSDGNINIKDANSFRNFFKESMNFREFSKYIFSNNRIFIKYILVLLLISMVVSLILPGQLYSQIIEERADSTIIKDEYIFPGVILMGVMAFFLGIIFDLYGRKSTLSLIILMIGTINFVDLFYRPTYDQWQAALLITLLYSIISGFVLIVGELGRNEYAAKGLSMYLSFILIGILIGAVIKERTISDLINIYPELTQEFFSEIRDFISSVIFMICIIALFIMSNINTTTTWDEQNWAESLYHLYIIHNSGLLLYEYSFKDEEDLLTADLISGGIIGLLTMLEEITRDKMKLRIIDHGTKKMLFQWDSKERVVFVLIIDRELLILRHKLNAFIKAFERLFNPVLDEFKGVNFDFFKEYCDKLIKLYFSAKYSEFFPNFIKE